MAFVQHFHEGLVEFKNTLGAFMIDSFKRNYGADWLHEALNPSNQDSIMTNRQNPESWDLVMIINLLHTHWDTLFRPLAGDLPRCVLTMVKSMRNLWAHQQGIGPREAYRTFDAMLWVLESFNLHSRLIEKHRVEALKAMYKAAHHRRRQPVPAAPGVPPALPTANPPVCPGCRRVLTAPVLYICRYNRCKMCIGCLGQFLNQGNCHCPLCAVVIPDEEILNIQYRFHHASTLSA